MTGSTINFGHPYPEGGDRVAVHSDIERLAKSVDAREKAMAQEVDGAIPYRGWLDEFTAGSPEPFADLPDGRYGIRYPGTAEAFDLPQNLLGDVLKESSGSQITITYRPNDAGAGWGTKLEWVRATNSSGTLRDRWQQLEKSIMRTAPVVLTGPAGEYPQSNSRGAVRLPFTVPTTVGRVRVHMRPWNFRTRKEWGPATLRGLMIARQESEFSGSITGSRWYAPNTDGATVTGSEGYTSEWFNVGLTEGNTFLLSYAVEWLDDVRDLVQGMCWSNFDLDKWDSTEPAVYQNGWGGFGLQPMDIWIECEAPSSVPVYGYFGSSNEVFAHGQAVFSAYPNVHARRNKAFAAITAAGGWSPMDDTFYDSDIVTRFGYPARMLDRLYMSMGANIAARGATAQEAIAKMERWLDVRLPSLGNPPVYMLTQISRDTSTETTDSAGTLSEWNEWVRYESTKRDDVDGLIDQAAIFADPEKPWTARVELRESPGDVHFSVMGQKLRAQALDGEITLPMLTAKDEDDVPWRASFEWAGTPHASESVMKVAGKEVARNRATNPSFETSGSSGLFVGSKVNSGSRTSVANRVSQGTYSTILSWVDDGEIAEIQSIVQQETDVLPGQWVAVSVDATTTTNGMLYAAGIISERGDSNNHIAHHYLGEYAQAGQGEMTTYVYVTQVNDPAVRRVRAGLRFSGTPEVFGLPTSYGYLDGFHIAVADTREDALTQVAEYFDGDTPSGSLFENLRKRVAELELGTSEVHQQTIPLTADWRTDVSSQVTAYRTGNVVTVAAWRLAAVEGATGDVDAFTLPPGYRPAGLTQQYTRDSRGREVSLSYSGRVSVTDPLTIVSHFSFTFVTLDDPIR